MATPNGSPTIAWFEWGAEQVDSWSTSPVEVGDGFGVQTVWATITGLEQDHNYRCRLVTSNALGKAVGAERRFTTGQWVSAWGSDSGKVTSSVWKLSGVTTLGTGPTHALATFADGTLAVWGTTVYSSSKIPPDLTNVVSVSGGAEHTMALRADGLVTAWGNNTLRQTNVPVNLSNVIAIASGGSHNLALKMDGTIAAWGSTVANQTIAVTTLTNVVAIAASGLAPFGFCLALKADGTVVAWGNNTAGQTNVPIGLTNVIRIAAGGGTAPNVGFCLALTADGNVVAWGNNNSGQTNLPPSLTNVIDIAAGHAHALALRNDSSVVAWGSNASGQTNVPAGLKTAVAIAANGAFSLALGGAAGQPFAATQTPGPVTSNTAVLGGMATPNGTPTVAWFEWGTATSYGKTAGLTNVGDGFRVARVRTLLSDLAPGAVYHGRLVASNQLGIAYGADRMFATGLRVAAWGEPLDMNTRFPEPSRPIVAVAGSHLHSLALTSGGRVLAWGETHGKDFGQTNTPAGISNVVAIAGGLGHSLAIKEDGTIAAWGAYGWTWEPVVLPDGLSNVVAVASGDIHSLALTDHGRIVSWGTSDARSAGLTGVPPGLGNTVAVAAGAHHSLALNVNGQVAAWGDSRNWPVPTLLPTDLTNIIAISTANWHSLALRSDGTVRAWGNNDWGQCNVPAALTNVVAIAAGFRHSLALRGDGVVVAWGDASMGQAGPSTEPGQVVAIAAGDYHSLTLAPNTAPLGYPLTRTIQMNQDVVLSPPCLDPNNDPLTFTVTALPTAGSLYQWAAEGRGSAIASSATPVTDPEGRVVFAPAANGSGIGYATLTFAGSDGQYLSTPGTVTLDVLPAPTAQIETEPLSTNGPFTLTFVGLSNASYSVWTSTNLVDWTRLGPASVVAPTGFRFSDTAPTNWPQRFYQIAAP